MSDVEEPDYFKEPETHIDKQKIMTELKQKIADEKTNDELREEIQRLKDEQEQRIRKAAIEFFYYWWNRDGNTFQGFDEFWEAAGKRIMAEPLAKQEQEDE